MRHSKALRIACSIGSFGLGIAFGMIIIGVIFTSRYAIRIREFKMRMLGKSGK